MKIEVYELTDTKAKLIFHDVQPTLLNAIRRSLMADVPKMAIEEVEFHLGPIRDEDGNEYESMSPLFDEIVAHRLGMVPIPTDLTLFGFREDCSCDGEGCPNCTIMYALNKKGPCTVYSGDLEPLGDAKYSVVDDQIPIVKLDRGQALLVYATAILGTGKEHVKWQVATGVGYKNFPLIEIDNHKCDKCNECVKLCPPKILSIKKDKLEANDLERCVLCKSCEETCEMGAIKMSMDESKFILSFETDGSLPAKEALTIALMYLEETYDELKDTVSELKEEE